MSKDLRGAESSLNHIKTRH